MPDPALTEERALERLVEDGFLRHDDGVLRTTARFQAALARAAYALQRASAPWHDLRLPIAAALAAHYRSLGDQDLAVIVEAMLSVEERELPPAVKSAVVAGR